MVIVDQLPFKYSIQESSASGGPIRVRGVFQRADEKNANGRVYPRALWERILGSNEVREAIDRRRMVGEIDHPMESEMKLSRVSHIVTGLSLNENGEVEGEFEILPTVQGRHLESLLKSGVECGISSRGEGSTQVKDGVEMIADDYRLMTFDVVASPSTRGAYPKVVNESKSEEVRVMPTFNEVRSKAEEITRADLAVTTRAQRESMVAEIPALIESLDRISNEDPGYRSLAESTVRALQSRSRVIESAAAPPVVEAQVEAAAMAVEEVTVQLGSQLSEAVQKNQLLAEENAELRARLETANAVGEELLESYRRRLRENRLMETAGDQILADYKKLVEATRRRMTVREQRVSKSLNETTTGRRTSKLVRNLAESAERRRPRLTENTASDVDPVFESMRKNMKSLRY